jgi:hypothetical protein
MMLKFHGTGRRLVRRHVNVLVWFRRERQWRRDHIAAFSAVAQEEGDGLTVFQHQALSAVAKFVGTEQFKRITMEKEQGED